VSNELSLSQAARAGFVDLSTGRDLVREIADVLACDAQSLIERISVAADVDYAAHTLRELLGRSTALAKTFAHDDELLERVIRVLGASSGLGEFMLRTPDSVLTLRQPLSAPRSRDEYRKRLANSVGQSKGVAQLSGEEGRDALRRAYRSEVLLLAAFDLEHPSPIDVLDAVANALADLAGAAIDASLAVAKREVISSGATSESISHLEFAVIGMGKCGASELNYVSDVDVIFVGQTADESVLTAEQANALATKIAQLTMRGIHEVSKEPGLWEIDANLRPEGKAGALVRTLESHLAYYERWAKNWEFQALLKARPLAGSLALGEQYCAAVSHYVWSSAQREGFVDQVQRMRERVTDNIPSDDVDWQIKLGPGGLRDIEFTVQLLQLVHGQSDTTLRSRGTIESLVALRDGGYVGRTEADAFADHYRFLRVLEHRLQLRKMSRTHLMPRTEEGQRFLARSSGFDRNGDELLARWSAVKIDVRALHQKLFYRPLLAAVALLNEEDLALSSEQAQARLAAIGFHDTRSALAHISALTSGVSRRATIQRTLLPIILQWLAAGADPDYGLLSFRRLSEALGETHWYLRMLRDGVAAAERLAGILSGSRYVTDLLERIPEGVAWLDDDELLTAPTDDEMRAELNAILERHDDDDAAVAAIRMMRRREVLRMAMGTVVGVGSMQQTALGLTAVTRAAVSGFLNVALRQATDIEFAVIGMGRFGGGELSFGSDADVMFVYRSLGVDAEQARASAEAVATRILSYATDARLAFEIDLDLRPEGTKGPRVRSLESYASYYERWSEVWEAQALLRAAPVAGSDALLRDFVTLIDTLRYPKENGESDAREIRRIKARVEAERLPQGADPTRHLKLGRGSLSDVEWTVQLLQLLHGAEFPQLRTPRTLEALAEASLLELITPDDAQRLSDAWVLASQLRSALVLWGSGVSDVLPQDITDLDGVARLMGYAPGSAAVLEEHYLGVTRKARAVFERVFYGLSEPRRRTT
jgi:glutamate-ammonia-ligase adenylyltransferase